MTTRGRKPAAAKTANTEVLTKVSAKVADSVPTFVAEIEQQLKGKTTRQQAEFLQQQMANALQSQIGLKEAATMDFEMAVTKAETAVKIALMNNGEEISSPAEREGAVAKYLKAKDNAVEAKERLEHHLKEITWLKEGREIVNG